MRVAARFDQLAEEREGTKPLEYAASRALNKNSLGVGGDVLQKRGDRTS
jgi:hypothetical protein